MSLNNFVLALCVSLSFAASLSSSEESGRNFIKHILRIPNPDKVLNTVLGRLERNRQGLIAKERVTEGEDCEEALEALPEYTESFRPGERGLRQLGAQKHYPICHLERKIHQLNTNEYEYRPAYYEEVRCIPANSDDMGDSNEVDYTESETSEDRYTCQTAAYPGRLHGIQVDCTEAVARLSYAMVGASGSVVVNMKSAMQHFIPRGMRICDCWETRTLVIPAGCECMWPVHRLGDMSSHI